MRVYVTFSSGVKLDFVACPVASDAADVSAGVVVSTGGVVVAANAGAAVSTAPPANTPKAIANADARLRDGEKNEEAITKSWPDSQAMSRRSRRNLAKSRLIRFKTRD
ncbi:hypothetical protein C5E10_03430 [Pseudoclavibacter sp. RFBG4]|nr:hypothetical protein C5E10_03430 [Pseudoclavibacter sp. RFBG4]